jgi:hypothetical protein
MGPGRRDCGAGPVTRAAGLEDEPAGDADPDVPRLSGGLAAVHERVLAAVRAGLEIDLLEPVRGRLARCSS